MVTAASPRAVRREREDRRLAAQLLVGRKARGAVEVVDRFLASH